MRRDRGLGDRARIAGPGNSERTIQRQGAVLSRRRGQPCTPAIEAIDLEGIIHGQGSVWDNDHFKPHYNVTLIGTDAEGVKYLGTSTGNGKGDFPGSETEDVVTNTLLISQGGTPNFVVKIVLHFAGDGAVQVEKASEECRG